MAMHILAFWLAAGAVAVSVTWTNLLSRLAFERTVRHAIDRGLIGDAEIIARLRPPTPLAWWKRLVALGLTTAGTGAGVVALGLCLSIDKLKSLPALGGIGALTLFTAGGLVLAGLWMRRVEREPLDLGE